MYLYTEIEIPSYSGPKVIPEETDRQTHLTEIITYLQTRIVIKTTLENVSSVSKAFR